MTITQLIADYLTTLAAVSIGMIRFKKLDPFFRLVFFQMLIYLVIDGVALTVAFYYQNGWIYNISIIIETLLLLLAARFCFTNSKSVVVLFILFALFLVVFMLDIFIFTGFFQFAYHAAIAEGILLTGVYMFVLYHCFQQKNRKSIIFASLGIVLYFSCSVPYLGTMFYFQDRNPFLNQDLFQKIIVVLADLRYLFLAIALILANRTGTIVLKKS